LLAWTTPPSSRDSNQSLRHGPPARDPRVRRGHGSVIDDTDTIISATGADGWYADNQTSSDAIRATRTATNPDRSRIFCVSASHTAGDNGCRAVIWASTGAVRAARATTTDPDGALRSRHF
jgi:hypothetical protein